MGSKQVDDLKDKEGYLQGDKSSFTILGIKIESLKRRIASFHHKLLNDGDHVKFKFG